MDLEVPARSPHDSVAVAASTRGRIALHGAVRACIEESARRRYPEEACGLLIGRSTPERVEVVEAREANNVEVVRGHDRYVLDPVDHLAAEEHARGNGLEVVGAWHSHPDCPAQPSETDRRGAWANWSYLIVGLRLGDVTELRSWRLSGDRFQEETLE